jgi:hypothetical protein
MAPRQRDQFAALGAAQRLDHIEVIAPRAVKLLRKGIGIGADAVDLLRQQLDGFDQTSIAAIALACSRCNSSSRTMSAGLTGNGMMRTAITSSSSRTA